MIRSSVPHMVAATMLLSVSGCIVVDIPVQSGSFGSDGYVAFSPAARPSYDEGVLSVIAPGVEGGDLATNVIGAVSVRRYAMDEAPFDSYTDYPHGPDTHRNVYSDTRHFFPVRNAEGIIGVLWQSRSGGDILATWPSADLRQQRTVRLPNKRDSEHLAAATSDPEGNLYYLTIEGGDGTSRNSARSATLHKANASGQELARKELDTSEKGLNMVSFQDSYGANVAALAHSGKVLGLMLGRRMHRSGDGLNHQGGIAVVFDATTLELLKHHGQTSGHSFENCLVPDGAGGFLALDLGDNYPRGVHLHGFNAENRLSRVVYTFKAEHGNTAKSPAGVKYGEYPGHSGYYKWSNDN